MAPGFLWSGSASRGWVVVKNVYDSTLHLTNIHNPCASVSSHKVITLPPLDDSKARIFNISLSASPHQQDCVVAATSCNPFISLCRPGDPDWTHIKIPFRSSKVTYSVRDSKFYLYWGKEQESDIVEANSDFPEVSLCGSGVVLVWRSTHKLGQSWALEETKPKDDVLCFLFWLKRKRQLREGKGNPGKGNPVSIWKRRSYTVHINRDTRLHN